MNGLYHRLPCLLAGARGRYQQELGGMEWGGERGWSMYSSGSLPAKAGSDLFLSQRPGSRSSSLLRAVGLTSRCNGFPLPTLLGEGRFTVVPCLPHTLTQGPSCVQCTLRLHATPPTRPVALAVFGCVWQVAEPFHSPPKPEFPYALLVLRSWFQRETQR